jgi:ferredoxin
MVKYGRKKLIEKEKEVTLERHFIDKRYKLMLNRSKCTGCGICVKTCPKRAIEFDENLPKEERVNLNESCILCGICVIVCDKEALKIMVNDKEVIPVLEALQKSPLT